MFEEILSIIASGAVCILCLLRLNELTLQRLEEIRRHRPSLTLWRVLEGLGLAIVAAGCVGVAGEWFLPGESLSAETIVMVGAAIFGVGVSQTLQALAALIRAPDAGAPRARIPELAGDELEGRQ